jgi:hypothetical protein
VLGHGYDFWIRFFRTWHSDISITIDISWVDYAYTASTSCDVMYCQLHRHLFYGGENLIYYLTPSSAAALTTNSNGTLSAHIILMSVLHIRV